MSEYLEFQRYGRNKSTLVDSNYISSGEYRKKFDKITANPDFSRLLYAKAKEMLLHRSGTMYELHVADYYNQLHDEYEAQLMALKELSEIYDIEFWEVV